MAAFLRVIIVLFVLLPIGDVLIAQTPEPVTVEKSTQKVTIGNKTYYVHTVKKGETLFSISKAYGLTNKEITDENPETTFGIQTGQSIKIPEKNFSSSIEAPKDYTEHTVEPGQTLYSLSKQYKVAVEELLQKNPELEQTGLKSGQVIRIPDKKQTPAVKPELVSTETYIVHEVQPKETLYSISRQYKVSVDELKKLNEETVKLGLKTGNQLKVPMVYQKPVVKQPIADTSHQTTQTVVQLAPVCPCLNNCTLNRPLEVALLLPLFSQIADRNTPLESEGATDSGGMDPISSNFMEFYEGCLLALQQLKDSGISVNLHVFDTERSTDRMNQIIGKLETVHPDLIIGPVLAENLKTMADFALAKQIPMVSPVSTRSEFIQNNPWVFQVNPPQNLELELTASFLARQNNKTLIFVNSIDPKDNTRNQELKSYLQFYLQRYGTEAARFKEISSSGNNLEHALEKDHENIYIFTSNEELYVTNSLRKLNDLRRSHPLTIVGTPAWTRFKNVDFNILHNLELEFFAPFHVDYNRTEIKQFQIDFKAMFGYYASRQSSYGFVYGMLGYDLMHYFVSSVHQYGNQFPKCAQPRELLTTRFNFTSTPGNGFINKSVSLIKFTPDFKVIEKEQVTK